MYAGETGLRGDTFDYDDFYYFLGSFGGCLCALTRDNSRLLIKMYKFSTTILETSSLRAFLVGLLLLWSINCCC